MHTGKKYVLTGGPGVGKTAVIEQLQHLGYPTVPEAYTVLFNEARDKTMFKPDSIDRSSLFPFLAQKQLYLEKTIKKGTCTFLDRGIVDLVAYADYLHVPIAQKIRQLAGEKTYTGVFFLAPLPDDLYKNTDIRRENISAAHAIHIMLQDAYKKMGYTYINVPFDTVENRAAFILKRI